MGYSLVFVDVGITGCICYCSGSIHDNVDRDRELHPRHRSFPSLPALAGNVKTRKFGAKHRHRQRRVRQRR